MISMVKLQNTPRKINMVQVKYARLHIDCQNLSHELYYKILAKVMETHRISHVYGYGFWNETEASEKYWLTTADKLKGVARLPEFTRRDVVKRGKNAADDKMIAHVMSESLTCKDDYVIVTGDYDFKGIVKILQNQGHYLIGIGEHDIGCDQYISLSSLLPDTTDAIIAILLKEIEEMENTIAVCTHKLSIVCTSATEDKIKIREEKVTKKESTLSKKEIKLTDKERQIANRESVLTKNEDKLTKRGVQIANRESMISKKEKAMKNLQTVLENKIKKANDILKNRFPDHTENVLIGL